MDGNDAWLAKMKKAASMVRYECQETISKLNLFWSNLQGGEDAEKRGEEHSNNSTFRRLEKLEWLQLTCVQEGLPATPKDLASMFRDKEDKKQLNLAKKANSLRGWGHDRVVSSCQGGQVVLES